MTTPKLQPAIRATESQYLTGAVPTAHVPSATTPAAAATAVKAIAYAGNAAWTAKNAKATTAKICAIQIGKTVLLAHLAVELAPNWSASTADA